MRPPRRRRCRAATTVVPLHLNFRAGSLRCRPVLRPDLHNEISPQCPTAGAHQLHGALLLGAVLVVLALLPLLLARTRLGRDPRFLGVWAVVLVVPAIAGGALLGLAEYHPSSLFVDL